MEHISAAHNGQYSILLKNKWNRQFSTNKIIPLFCHSSINVTINTRYETQRFLKSGLLYIVNIKRFHISHRVHTHRTSLLADLTVTEL